jgi:hypothetical protein
MRSAPLLILGLLAWASPGTAQHRLPGPAPSSLFGYAEKGGLASGAARALDDSLRAARPTYWKEGAVAGGLLGLVAGALLVHHLCGLDESTRSCTGSTLLGAGLGAVVLGVPGALIGGQIRKQR